MKLLKQYEMVVFTIGDEVYKYQVIDGGGGLFITCYANRNDIIFDKLGLNPMKYCKQIIKYYPKKGIFPYLKRGDYKNLTKVVNSLKDECNKYNFRQKKHEETS